VTQVHGEASGDIGHMMNQQEYSNILAGCLVTVHYGHFPAKRVKEQEQSNGKVFSLAITDLQTVDSLPNHAEHGEPHVGEGLHDSQAVKESCSLIQ